MNYYILLIIKLAVAAAGAVIFGNGAVVVFNHIPHSWFGCDKLIEDTEQRQRIISTPWKYIFMAYFLVCGTYMALTQTIQYETATLTVLFIVLEMAISDAKYYVVPDQLNILLAVTALGYIQFHEEWWEPLAGAGMALAVMLAIWGIGKLIYKRDAVGGADIKFFIAVGLISGRNGVICIFILTTIVAAIHVAYLIISGRGKLKDKRPMLPYALIAITIYLLFMWDWVTTIIL